MGINRWNYNFTDSKPNTLLNKKELIDRYIKYMLNRTQTMFNYKNLPETIPKKDLELILQTTGYVIISKVKNELYAFYGGLGGVPNAYYLPTTAIINNPYLKYNKNLTIDKDCVVILNDNLYQGLIPMFERNSTLLAECDLSMQFALINSRLPHLTKAKTDNEKDSFDKLFNDVIEGNSIKAILSKNIMDDSFSTVEFSNRTSGLLKDLIETKQYILGSWYQELGLNANYNMKRESLNKNEIDSNEDTLIPLINEMLNQRIEGVEKVNKMFNVNIEVELSSSWQKVFDDLFEKDEKETEEEIKTQSEILTEEVKDDE